MAEASATIETGGERRFLTFWLEDQLYALPADETAEVIRVPAVARVPQGPHSLMGLGNLRGSVLPFASARRLVGRPDGEASRAIVLAGAAPVALAVDRIEALVAVDAARIVTEQAEPARVAGERLRGAFQVPGGEDIAKILDVWPLLTAQFTQRPRPPRRTADPGHLPSQSSGAVQATKAERLVTFILADQEFGLPLERVREIISPPDAVAAAPRTEAVVVGVMAYRDSLLPLLSLRGLLGLPAASTANGREKVLVVPVGATLVGLMVDNVRAIVAADPGHVDPTPPMLAARSGGESQIRAIYRGEGGRRLISILDADKLFREDLMPPSGEQGARTAAPDGAQSIAGADLRVLVFRLGEDEFGLPIEAVDEVARAPDQVTHLPKTPKFLAGVINLRGEVLPVVDQRRRFDMPPAADQGARRLIVVRTERHRAGLIVDSVSEVLRSTNEAIEPAPHLTGEATRLVQGVINLDGSGRIILLLDPAELLTRAERGLLDAFQPDPDPAAP